MMNMQKLPACGAWLTVASLLSIGVASGAKPIDMPESNFDPSRVQPWKEVDVVLPAYPHDTDLVAVAMAPSDRLKLFVDTKSVSVAEDGVMRLALVVESPSGVRNVFFDGIRCETRAYKTYAIGAAEKTWIPVKQPAWREIPPSLRNAFRFQLYKHYACDSYTSSALKPTDFVDRLRRGSPSENN